MMSCCKQGQMIENELDHGSIDVIAARILWTIGRLWPQQCLRELRNELAHEVDTVTPRLAGIFFASSRKKRTEPFKVETEDVPGSRVLLAAELKEPFVALPEFVVELRLRFDHWKQRCVHQDGWMNGACGEVLSLASNERFDKPPDVSRIELIGGVALLHPPVIVAMKVERVTVAGSFHSR